MKIKMIGTGAIGAKQNSASTLIDETILVDCGNGTVKAMLKNDIDINKIQAVLITHFHMDHFLDLPIFLLTRTFKYKEGTLTVYGPKGIEANCKELYDKYMNDGDSFETIKKNTGINFIEVENGSLHNLVEYTIKSYEVTHGNISDCYGYTLEKNNCKIGFTGDASLCENVLKIIDESYLTIIDMCYLKGNIYHLGCDNIENICRNNPNKKYIPTHMTTISRNYIMDKKNDNLTILNDYDDYVIGKGSNDIVQEKMSNDFYYNYINQNQMKEKKHMEKRTIFVFKGILFNKENEILIDNRKEEILDDANEKWEVPGGKIEFGETPEDAVKRELFEETGYNVKVNEIIPYSKVSMWQYSDYEQHTVIFFYMCELADEEHINRQDYKINGYKWVKKDELDNYNFLPGNKEAIEIAIKIKESK